MSDEKKIRRKQDGGSHDTGSAKADRDVGHALRSVYSNTVNEQVPAELLDLLGKLD